MGGSYHPSNQPAHAFVNYSNQNLSSSAMPTPSAAETASVGSSYPELNFGVGNKWVKNLYQDRLGTFLGGHYSDVNLSSVLFTHRIDDDQHIKLTVWSAPGRSKPTFEEAMKQKYRTAHKGESFGPSWTNHWWKISLKIPSSWSKYERIQFEFDPGCEAMVYSTDGTPLQAITGGYGGERRVDYIIQPGDRKKGTLDIVIESSCNGMFGVPWSGDAIDPPDMNRYFRLDSADLVVPNQEAWRLMWDWNVLRDIINNLPGNNPLQNRTIAIANEIMDVFNLHYDKEKPEKAVSEARKVAEKILGKGWNEKGHKVYEEGDRKKIDMWGIGYCHIDTAWLWPYSVTQQKVARSWTTQVDLMERYPEHRFTASSAQQFKWLEQLYPKAFENVKAKVAEGKFHLIGGSWVENDANMPSGEALARQFVYGQRYFESRFGKRCDTAWLPDSFGLTGSLPQLIRESGMAYFFTQKLSWNNINRFPHTTFNWVGIDGTQVLSHMTPVDTYTAQANLSDVRRGIIGHKNLESSDTALLVFGNGDGGGGPLAPMLENLRRLRAVANETKSTEFPIVQMGNSVEDFFKDVEVNSKEGSTLPNWHGELYLEFHRGTYTSHGIIKKGNRKSEVLLREVELITTIVSLFKKSYVYPKKRIDDLWEDLLLNQFHDVLPGSAIGMVYDDAEKIYDNIAKQGRKIIHEALQVVHPKSIPLPLEPGATTSKAPKGRVFAFNTVHAPRREVVAVDLGNSALTSYLQKDTVQVSRDGKTGYVLAEHPGAGLAPVTGLFTTSGGAQALQTSDGDFVLKNGNIKMTLSGGRITSLYDLKLERELISKGRTGGMVIFTDRPTYWDAWDTEVYDIKSGRPLEFESIKVVENGPVLASIDATIKLDKSTIKVTISISSLPATTREDSRSSIRFDAEVDWHQRHEFLKFEIPLNISAPTATFDAAFGNVSRPTHRNTTLELAKFEVCGHKYADLSEYGYGVAILSESKYGFAAEGNVLRISLLRSATAPDPNQDQGYNSFSWALHPHANHFLGSDVPLAGFLFNSPVHLHYASQPLQFEPLMTAPSGHPGMLSVENAPNVILETVKRSDDDDLESKNAKQHVILRLYEAYGGHADARLRISSRAGVTDAKLVNFLEDEKDSLKLNYAPSVNGGGDKDLVLDLPFRGFQVHTVKLAVDVKKSSSDIEEWIDVLRI